MFCLHECIGKATEIPDSVSRDCQLHLVDVQGQVRLPMRKVECGAVATDIDF